GCLLLWHPIAGEAQEGLTLRRSAFELGVATGCPAIPGPISARRPNPGATDSLLAAGSQAAILGDNEAAVELLRAAVASDPSSAVASYRLARTLDDQGDRPSAV